MKLPTESQWAWYSALCARLRPLPAAEREAVLRVLRTQGDADPQVLSLVALHYALPSYPDRMRTGERLGNFTLEEPLGVGGMGVVYRAQQHIGPTRRPVAVKLIHPTLLLTARDETLTRFLAEMHTLVMLQHENIARIYDGGIFEDPRTHEQIPYLAMELVRGGVPITTYARDYALSWQERLALFVRVCHAVRYAHEHRVVHRDLKPANVLVDSEGHPVVIDFGLAQACDAVLPGAHLAASGTPAYMSPEQVSDALGAVTDKSDVYALGLMLYELLTEQHPYVLPRDGAVVQWLQVILETTPPPLRQSNAAYAGELEAIMAAALAKRPTDRISVAVLRSRLERYLQTLPSARDNSLHETHTAQQSETGTSSAPLARRPDIPEAERRQLTVLVCRLVGVPGRGAPLDPEELLEVVPDYQAMCAEVVRRFEGHIAQYQGDRLVVYFGYPQAHEDDARRAVHTGLGMVVGMAVGMAEINQSLKRDRGVRLAVRVGIHTGVVVVGARGQDEHAQPALGETPTIAAQVQGLAAPGTVVISLATWQLVEGYFVSQVLGSHILEETAEPLMVYQVRGEGEAQSRFEVAVSTGLTPLVGRAEEVGLLRRRWEQVKEGYGQVVLLSGEAGIGKSRLVQELREWVAHEGATRIAFRCSPYHQNSALYPVLEHLQRVLQFHRDEAPQAKLAKLERVLRTYRFAQQEIIPLFAALLSLPHPEGYPPLHLSPERQKQRTQEALLAWLFEEAERQPVLAVWEDLHWADPSSLEALGLLVDQPPTARLLTLLMFRSEFRPPWGSRSHLTQLTLTRFTRRQVEEMVLRMTGGKPLPAAVVQQIVAKTDGVPLFVEELTKVVLESGWLQDCTDHYELTGPLPALAIPTTLQDSLMARLDRLATIKTVVQLGATLGRQFTYELLQAVSSLDEVMLQHELGRLVEAELLYQRGVPPQATYTFKHALLQDAAYQSLLRSTRQHHHQRIAQVLEARFPETVATQPELLAHHYTQAGCDELAITYWQRAGRRAYERSAYVEAISHLTQGLEVLQAVPDTPARARQEILLQATLGAAYTAAKGYAAPDVERAYTRARVLCQQTGDTRQLFPVLVGLWNFYFVRGESRTACALGEQLLTLAESANDPVRRLRAHAALGEILFHIGQLLPARTHLEQGIALYAPQQRRSHAVQTPTIACLAYAAWTLWHLGYPDQALQRSDEARTLAQELSHPLSLAIALHFTATLHQFRREAQAAQKWAEAATVLSREQGLPFWDGSGTIMWGWALAAQGRGEEGLAQIRQGLVTFRATGAEVQQPSWLALLAEACGWAGQVAQGLNAVAEALAIMDKTGERYYEAELYRLKGELLLQAGEGPQVLEAEAGFHQALSVARRRQAKFLELRAAMSLSRLWQRQGKRNAARPLLAEVYSWFTEGFDTADLQEAKALLEELS
jgi:TOMM system kinase/cyclase fusion protein